MTRPPFLTTVRGRGPGDHVCWGYRGAADLRAAARDYVGEGLSRGERVAYVGQGSRTLLAEALDDVVGLDHHVRRGHVVLAPVATMPGSDPANPLADEASTLHDLAAAARAEGYTGLRMLADVTTRVTGAARRAEYVAYEHLIDRFCLERGPAEGFTALCAFDIERLGDAAVGELAGVHAYARDGTTAFVVRADPHADLALAGTVEAGAAERLVATLGRLRPASDGVPVAVDVSELEFIDHRGLLALDAWAGDRATAVELRGARPLHVFVTEALRLARVRATPGGVRS